MSTEETTTREFIVVGQNQGSSFTLWDVAPAPTDPAKRTIALEEIHVDADDAFGDVDTVWATDATTAVDLIVADLREQSGLDDYTLSEDSNMEAYGERARHGTASTLSASAGTLHLITATCEPGPAMFSVAGVRSGVSEIRDRVRAAVANSDMRWPAAQMTVDVKPVGYAQPGGVSSLDLAVACTVLSASGQLPAGCLDCVSMVGELGLDGAVRAFNGLGDLLPLLTAQGRPKAYVPAAFTGDPEVPGVARVGVDTLLDAVTDLKRYTGRDTSAEAAARPSTTRS